MTRKSTSVHHYHGRLILPCERIDDEHAGRWIVQTYHHTGAPWADELCPHFPSLAAAREAINEWRSYYVTEAIGLR